MSSLPTIVNDCERGDSVQQPSTGRYRETQRRFRLHSSSPSADEDPGAAATTARTQRTPLASAVEPGTHQGNNRRGRQMKSPPVAAVEPITGAENTRRGRQSRPPPVAAVGPITGAENTRCGRQSRPPPVAAVKQRTSGENTRRTSQRRTLPAAAVQPGTRKRNTTRRKPSTPPTADEECGAYEECGTDEDDNTTGSRRRRVFELDLTPAERAIPNTRLLNDLGYHLSAYARAGRGPPTRNLNRRGAWRTAVELYHKANDQYKELFIAAGFGEFLEIEPVDVPVAYNLALAERWFSETNTLHLPCCEIGPTPVDWTMVTGLRFGGRCLEVDSDFKIERALDLLGKPGAIKDNKIHLEKIKLKSEEVEGIPRTDDEKEKKFRRLFIFVVGSCFFGNNRSVIDHNLVKCLERIDEVGSYDWGAITYATFLAGMRRKVTAEIGAFTAFWQFLPFWAFEYLDVNRPMHIDGNVFPRAGRWICPKGFNDKESPQFIGPSFIASRCQLDYVEESQVTWQPYLASPEYISEGMQDTINLAKKRIQFQSIHTWEYYLGERCRQQLGFPCRVPSDPPQIMHGPWEGHLDNGISAETLVKEHQVYASWFAKNSIGRILDVTRFLGGPDIAGKVLDQWRVKHQPDLIPIQQSQYEQMKKDLNALEQECTKLQDELSQARGEESCHA